MLMSLWIDQPIQNGDFVVGSGRVKRREME